MNKMSIMKKRRRSGQDYPKVVKTFSFSGKEGYEALMALEESNHILGKSGLVTELLRTYQVHKIITGIEDDNEAINYLKAHLRMEY